MKKSFGARAFLSWTFAVCLVAACGGRIDSVNGESDDADAGSGGGGSITGSDDAGRIARDSGHYLDAATKPDADVCVDISTSSFDTSCGSDDDCINVTIGHICESDNCLCGGAAISASEQDAYVSALGPIANVHSACGCPYLGRPRCVQSQCIYCPAFDDGTSPAGCPDGG